MLDGPDTDPASLLVVLFVQDRPEPWLEGQMPVESDKIDIYSAGDGDFRTY